MHMKYEVEKYISRIRTRKLFFFSLQIMDLFYRIEYVNFRV